MEPISPSSRPPWDELEELDSWNRAANESGARWLPVLPYDGRFASVGPLVVPGQSCCYECVLRRRAANLEYGEHLREIERAPLAARADPAFETFVAASPRTWPCAGSAAGTTVPPGCPLRRRGPARAVARRAPGAPRPALSRLLAGRAAPRRPFRGTRPRPAARSRLDRRCDTARLFGAPSRRTPASSARSRSAFTRAPTPASSGSRARSGVEAGCSAPRSSIWPESEARASRAATRRPQRSARHSSGTPRRTFRTNGSWSRRPGSWETRQSRPSGLRSSRPRSTRETGFPFRPFTARTRVPWVAGLLAA